MHEEFERHIETIISSATEKFELAGLYTINSGVGLVPADGSDADRLASLMNQDPFEDDAADKPNVGQLLRDGELEAVVFLTFRVGELAWSERVLDPELHQEKQDFAKLMPTEDEIAKPVIVDEILNDNWDDFDFGE